jgi:chemotaxis protein CheD
MKPAAGRRDIIVVGVGDCRIAKGPACLATYALGSCIALVAWDWKLKIGGLLHVMLPDSSIDPDKCTKHPHRYVDTGVPALFKGLSDAGSSRAQLRWCLVGGAAMMAGSAQFEIGKRNHLAVRKMLWKLGVFVEKEDVGGSESRSVWLDVATGQTSIRKGIQAEQVLMPAVVYLQRNPENASTYR